MLARMLLLTLPLLASACGGDPVQPTDATAPPPPAAQTTARPAAQPAPVPGPAAELSGVQVAHVLAPSPLELQARLRDAGIADDLAALVPPSRFPTAATSDDVVAIRTGVRTADAIMVGPSADKADFVARLKQVREGMARIGAGEGLLANLDDVVLKVENDAASREEFVDELDAVTSTMVPEGGWGPDDKSGPLVQAGAWLGGTDLVAQAIIRSGSDAAADKLLRQPEVAEYFLEYAQHSDKAPGPVRDALIAALGTMRDVAKKPEPLTVADAQAVHDAATKLFGFI